MDEKSFIQYLEKKFKTELEEALRRTKTIETSTEKVKSEEKEEELPVTFDASTGVKGTPVSCDTVEALPADLFLVFGKKNIEKIRQKELSDELNIAPVYFADEECPDLRSKLGIESEGVYHLDRDKKKIKKTE